LLRGAGCGRIGWCAALAAMLAAAGARADALGPEIDVWYGTPQTFGVPGLAQQWVNVLGNVSDPDGVAALSYTLNGGPPRTLSIGKDSRRLVSTGDFNVEIDFAELASGANSVAITARDSLNNTSVANVTLNYAPSTLWPLPFEMELAGVTDIQDVAQVVDGEWIIESNGLRCPTMGYDRVLAVGDLDWSEYEVTATITMLDMDPGGFAWPSVSPGFGITLRWPGHSDDPVVCIQPHCGWLPSGAGIWYDTGHDGPLVLDGDLGLFQQQNRTLDYDVPYVFKLRVESAGELGTFYAAKVWAEGDAEPAGWELSGYEPVGDVASGSCIFVAHHVDIRIEDVAVAALGHTAPPVISAVQVIPAATSATITWQTDEPTTGFVSFGPTAAYEEGDVASPGSGTDHGVELLGLTSGATYHYRITAVDLSSNAAVTEDATFVALVDSDPPEISNVQVAADPLSAVITWNTDEPATSRVEYGLTSAYGNATSNGALVTAHVLDLFELAPDTLYHYCVLSTDASGNTQATGDLTFATSPDPPSVLVSDSFNQPALDTSLWTFVNPLGDAAVSMTGTQVQIALPVTGSDHEIWTSGNTAPRITQAAPDSDFEFLVKFDSPLTEQLQIQGVAVEQDAVNVIRAEFHRLNGINRIYVASIFGASADTHIHQPVAIAPPMFLRVRRDGDAFTVSWSTDGDNWTVAAAFEQPMTVTAVAIHMGAGAGSAHAMLADYFLDVSEPPLFDCNLNGIDDAEDLAAGTSQDCNASGVPDECELAGNDCDSNGVPDECDPDCNSNAVPDACEAFADCNLSGVPDECELAGNDCDSNGVPDECDPDCNSNAVPDACEAFTDCNASGVPDECELAGNDCDSNGVPDECDLDCNSNAVPDVCESFIDCNSSGIPDECELAGNDCDSNGVPDECDPDCNSNAVPDACESFTDCNVSGAPDECELAGNDCDSNGVPDECDPDCNSNAVPDACEAFADCNFSGVPDECELAGNDCDSNGVPDECDPDCNSNAVPDACEAFADCNLSGVPDECEFHFDCNTNAWPDSCDILGGSSADVNQDLVPDECQVRNLTQGAAHPTIAAALAFAQADDELLATPAHFDAEPFIDLQGKPVVLRSTYAIDLPVGGAFTLADGALLAAAPGYAIRQRGTLTARPMHDAELLAERFELEETGQLTVSVSAGLMVTAPSGATLAGSATLQPQATLVFSSDATVAGACALFGGVLSADQLHVAGALAELYGYGAVVADLVNDANVVIIADSQVIGDFTNNGATTIQNGTLTLTGSLIGEGVIIGGDSGGRRDAAPRSGAGVLFVAGDLVAGPAAGLYFSASTWSVRVGGDFDVAIASGQDVELVDAELRLTGLGGQEQLLEALGEDIGPVPAGWVWGAPSRFPIGRLTIGPTPTTVRLVNQHPNADPPATVQALYVDTLTVHTGATLITDGLRIYYRHLLLEGIVDEPGNLVPIDAPPGDCDLDGDSDLEDLPGLLDCLSGPQVAAPEFSALGCGCIATYDRDLDLDVDLRDFASFQAALEAP